MSAIRLLSLRASSSCLLEAFDRQSRTSSTARASVICSARRSDDIPKREPFSRSKIERALKEPSLLQKSKNAMLDYCSILEGDESYNCWKAYFELKDLEVSKILIQKFERTQQSLHRGSAQRARARFPTDCRRRRRSLTKRRLPECPTLPSQGFCAARAGTQHGILRFPIMKRISSCYRRYQNMTWDGAIYIHDMGRIFMRLVSVFDLLAGFSGDLSIVY